MVGKCRKFLYRFDLFGEPPHLRIFNEKKYKTSLGSILSIIIILLLLSFTIFSFIEFVKYNNPTVIYYKDNDKLTNRTFLIKDGLLIFGLVENEKFSIAKDTDAFFESELSLEYNNGSNFRIPLTVEKCEFGKNLDFKFKDSIETFSRTVNDFYCFSKESGDLPLFYDYNYGHSTIYLYAKINNYSKYSADDLLLYIMNGNDVIEHNNKNNPISNNYFTYSYTSFSSSRLTLINYYFQFIKYESDTGLIFSKAKTFNAKSFSHMTNIQTKYLKPINESEIGTIMIEISNINFDNYQRIYPRIQSLLAEIMAVFDLLIEIGGILSYIFINKLMSKDIVYSIISKNNIEENKIHYCSKKKNKIVTEDIEKKKFEESINKINNKNSTNITNSENTINTTDFKSEININTNNEIINNKNKKEKIFNDLNIYHFIKSFFCFEDKKTKLIDLCSEFIDEEISIENLLKKIYELENKINFIGQGDDIKSSNFTKNKKLLEINNCISRIEKNQT